MTYDLAEPSSAVAEKKVVKQLVVGWRRHLSYNFMTLEWVKKLDTTRKNMASGLAITNRILMKSIFFLEKNIDKLPSNRRKREKI